jgi:hypothetical protein
MHVAVTFAYLAFLLTGTEQVAELDQRAGTPAANVFD